MLSLSKRRETRNARCTREQRLNILTRALDTPATGELPPTFEFNHWNVRSIDQGVSFSASNAEYGPEFTPQPHTISPEEDMVTVEGLQQAFLVTHPYRSFASQHQGGN